MKSVYSHSVSKWGHTQKHTHRLCVGRGEPGVGGSPVREGTSSASRGTVVCFAAMDNFSFYSLK